MSPKKVSKDKQKEMTTKEMTTEEINDFLKNSINIPKEQWQQLPINSFISYFKNDGKFVKGGYIKLIFNKNNSDNIDNDDNKYYKEFTINLSNIKEIYKKIDNSALIEYQIIKNNITKLLNSNNSKIDEIINKLNTFEKKINKLEENHYKTLKLIKNLHNINNLDNIK
jgi:vacuolar-type H+-ATPase subunit I/STV1